MPLRLPQVPAGKILVHRKWCNTPLGKDLIANHGGVEFNIAEDIDFAPARNLPVLLINSDNCNSNTSARIKKFREIWGSEGVVVAERNTSSLKQHKDVQTVATLKKDLNVIPVANMQEIPALLKDLAYAQSHPQNNHFSSTKEAPLDLASKQLHLMTLIPNVGRTKAQALVENFGTLKRISYANLEEMTAVVGFACASSVHNFFHKPLTT